MAKMAFYFFTAGTLTLGVATLLYLWRLGTRGRSGERLATVFLWMGGLLLTGSMASRWIASGHGPFSNTYEYSVSFAWAIAASYAVVEQRYRVHKLGGLVLPIALALLIYAATAPASIEPLIPALQNRPVLTAHVSVAIIAYGIFAVAFGAAVVWLVQGPNNRLGWLPPAEVMDDIAYRLVLVGFPFLSVMLILGAYWANIVWGRYWGWDPKESASLVTWLIYAAYLHTRTIARWRGRPSAILLVIGFAATLFTFIGVNLVLGTLHSFGGA